MSPRKLDKTSKKKEILFAATKVFAMKGVANTKMSDIALEAGIGKGTIYEYFQSKDAIFYESFRFFMEQTDSLIANRLDKIQNPKAKLEAWIDGWLESLSNSLDQIGIMMDYWAEGIRSRKEDSAFNIKNIYEKYRQTIKKILDEGVSLGIFKPVNTMISASILIGTLDGLALQWIMDKNLFRFIEASQILKDSFLNGLMKK